MKKLFLTSVFRNVAGELNSILTKPASIIALKRYQELYKPEKNADLILKV